METSVYNMQGEKVGMIDLPASVFGLPWNAALVQQAVEAERRNARAGTAHTKDRGEVSGGGKKPWQQKGTGRARHGSIRSPLWKGGGVTHGPRVERMFSAKINKRARRKALLTSLSEKARDNEIVIFDVLTFEEARTRNAARMFRSLADLYVPRIGMKGGTVLVALASADRQAVRALKNLAYVQSAEARNLSAHQVLASKYIALSKEALPVLETFAEKLTKHG